MPSNSRETSRGVSSRIGRMLSCNNQECALYNLRDLTKASEDPETPQKFLDAVEAACFAMDAKISDRSYRQKFSENYRVLFQQSARLYRVEFWHSAVNDYESIVVNGEVHVFSPAIRSNAQKLQASREDLLKALNEWHTSSTASRLAGWKRWFPITGQSFFRRVADALEVFDQRWVRYEAGYVAELMGIESHARKPVEIAIALEQQLSGLEGIAQNLGRHDFNMSGRLQTARSEQRSSLSSDESLLSQSQCSEEQECCHAPQAIAGSPSARTSDKGELHQFAKTASSKNYSKESHRVLRELVEQVAVLNARANTQGKGRGDLTVEVLVAAADLLCIADSVASSAEATARRFLASKVLDSFVGLRGYLSSICNDVMEVDPQLSKNPRLVKALVAWEEAWELGERILLRPEMLQALCGSAGLCAEALQVIPELREHVQDQDAELFMILPRLVILSDFCGGGSCEVLRFYLPSHFQEDLGSELQELKEEFNQIYAGCPENSLSQTSLVRWAVLGFGSESQHDGFLRRLERFSMEMQRHRPSDWNQCCLVLLQCIEAVML